MQPRKEEVPNTKYVNGFQKAFFLTSSECSRDHVP